MNQERVQFFNSQSSFGSQSSLANSRYFDLTDQIAQQTQSIFITLKKQFLPTKQLTNLDKIQYLNNRAQIIANDTIHDHLQYLDKINAPKQSKQICRKCSEQLKKFIKDFQSLKNGIMLHKQFYNIYGRSNQNNTFFKKNYHGQQVILDQYNMMSPDVVQIDQPRLSRVNNNQNDYKISARGIASTANNQKDKDIRDLHEQIAHIKKRQINLKKEFDQLLTHQKINCQKRIKIFLNSIADIDKRSSVDCELQKLNNYKNETTILQNSLQTALKQKKQAIQLNRVFQQKLSYIQRQNQSLKQQLNGYRKLQNSRISELQEQMGKSFHSQYNNDSSNPKKTDLALKKITAQRDILRSQLNRQRQKLHKDKIKLEEEKAKQLIRVKKYLQQRNQQNQELQRQFDKLRIQIIQLRLQNKSLKKDFSAIKQNNQKYRNKSDLYNLQNISVGSTNLEYRSEKNINFKKGKPDNNGLQQSIVSKTNKFDLYQGEGIQGYPYFQLLSKQFKIRFRRACLKNKQLLYKADGLQIGVISQFFAPNCIKVLVHITNSSEVDIKNFKVKVMNPNQNKVEYEVEQVKILSPSQQIKIPVSCIIKNYPIGPVVLVISYTDQIKHDMRLLLPVHIFKCVQIENRQQKLVKPQKQNIKVQRKICKDLKILKQYLNCHQNKQIKLKIKHQHSNSYLYMDINFNKDDIVIEYEHIEGFQNFTQYFIKTFKTLLQKQN